MDADNPLRPPVLADVELADPAQPDVVWTVHQDTPGRVMIRARLAITAIADVAEDANRDEVESARRRLAAAILRGRQS
jgi:hypothetical protein